ncbi:ABC transporter substrate-binding protein [Enterocloster hominis (ex Hitch et al. 2024)]|uniref:ABC transporter substrate-binding protein n=1 Tax=Enterocloster hominis (ex Hitch et al. 2024) TaxID=1917870 RepID=A0ABV1D3C2_9FIRM
MKKTAFMLAAAMTVMACAGCGGGQTAGQSDSSDAVTQAKVKSNGASSSEGELIFAWWGNQTRNERTQKVLDLYTEQNPNITFDGQPSEYSDYWNKLATAAAGNSLPDIIQMDYKYLDQYVKNGLLADLTPYVESGLLDISDCNQDIIASGKSGDGLYALCIGIAAPSFVYSKTVTEQAGVDIHENMSMDEFLDACRQIYEKTGYKTNIAYGDGEQYVEYLLRSKGITMFEDGRLGGEASDYVEYFDLYETGTKEGWLLSPSVFVERTKTTELNPLVYGTSPESMAWCTFHFSNQYPVLVESSAEDNEIGITTWPSNDVKKSNYLKPNQFLCVSRDARNPEEAIKFINWFNNSTECNDILLGERGVPVSQSVADAIASKLPQPEQEMIAYINDVASPNSSQVNPPATSGASEVIDLLNQLEEQVCYGQMTAQEAGNELFTRGNEMMSK